MKAILLIGAIVLILGASFSPQGQAALNTASSSSLPAVQRTAVYAPAVATKSAGASLNDNAQAQAAAQEQEQARIYAQAQADEQAKRVAVATQQAAFATQTANDIAVSKEFATLSAVSIQATSESISRTIAYDSAQYHANIAAIQATTQAYQAVQLQESNTAERNKLIENIWWLVPPIFFAILAGAGGLAAWNFAGRIKPRPVYEDEPDEEIEPALPPHPVQPPDLAKIAATRAAYNMALRCVEDSIRKNQGTSSKIITATEWEALGTNRDNHTIALGYLKDRGLIRTQQGGKPEDQGTFVQEPNKDLVYLLRVLSTTPPTLEEVSPRVLFPSTRYAEVRHIYGSMREYARRGRYIGGAMEWLCGCLCSGVVNHRFTCEVADTVTTIKNRLSLLGVRRREQSNQLRRTCHPARLLSAVCSSICSCNFSSASCNPCAANCAQSRQSTVIGCTC